MQTVIEYLKGISVEQYSSLFIALFLFGIVRNVAQRLLSAVLTLIGIMLVIYFIYPDGYRLLAGELTRTLDFIGGGGGDALIESVKNS